MHQRGQQRLGAAGGQAQAAPGHGQCARHRAVSFGVVMVSQGEEDVVQGGAVHGEARDQDPVRVGRVEQRADLGGAAVGRHADRQAGRVAVHRTGRRSTGRPASKAAALGQVRSSRWAATRRFSSAAVPSAIDAPAVQDRDRSGQPVGLLQVLRGEEDGHAGGGQALDDPPHGQAALRVEAGRRLVEEDHRRMADQAGGEVEPAAHPARVGAHPAPAGRGQLELLEQLGRAPPGRRPGQP